ncbi:MAG: hypothetical protein K0R84_2761 [Clostridia bacterium]|nr:hypothetical protein [Clostridia bacterium]
MATWLTHLRIAEKVKEKIADISLPYLIMGSIAPDSGAPDETYRSYNPPKEVTHFETKDKEEGKSNINLEDFYEKYLSPAKIITRSDNTRSFLWGYYFHLITDAAWVEFAAAYKRAYEEEQHEGKDFTSVMREETYGLDFIYLDQNGNDIIHKFKNIKADINFFNEFEPSYIYECQKRIVNYYEKERYVLDREYRFFTSEKIDAFIERIAQRCIDILL